MTEKNIKSRIVHKHDIETNWNKATSFVPKQGELIIYDIDENYSYERFKIGDGKTNVNDLSFAGQAFIDVDALPTENIHTNTFYRLKETVLEHYTLINGEKNVYEGVPVTVYTVDTLPAVGKPWADVMPEPTQVAFYFQISDNKAYLYTDETLSSMTGWSVGWSAPIDFELVTSSDDATEADTNYIVQNVVGYKYRLYTYMENSWCEIPFGYEQAPAFDITWDGVIGDRFALDLTSFGFENTYMVKVSDTVFTEDELLGATYTQSSGYQHTIAEDSFDVSTYPGAINVDGGGVVIIYSSDDLNTALGAPTGYITNGTYFIYVVDEFYTNRLVAPSKLKKIDQKFLPNIGGAIILDYDTATAEEIENAALAYENGTPVSIKRTVDDQTEYRVVNECNINRVNDVPCYWLRASWQFFYDPSDVVTGDGGQQATLYYWDLLSWNGTAGRSDQSLILSDYYATKTDLDSYATKDDIPTQLSDLSEDATHRTVTDAEKAKWNNVTNATPDYAENDPSESSYIRNRPFYQNGTDEPVHAFIEMDRSGTAVSLEINYTHSGGEAGCTSGTAYLVSNSTYTRSQLIGATAIGKYTYLSNENTYLITGNSIVEETSDGLWIRVSEGFSNTRFIFVAYTTNYQPHGLSTPFPAIGVYFTYAHETDDPYVQSLTIDYEPLKKLDNKFLDLPKNDDFKELKEKVEEGGIFEATESIEEYLDEGDLHYPGIRENGIAYTTYQRYLDGDDVELKAIHKNIHIPIVAGENIEFTVDADDTIKINTTGATLDKVAGLDTWYGDFEGVKAAEDGILWNQTCVMLDGSDNVLNEGGISQKIPLVAGKGVSFDVDEEHQIVKVNTSGATVDEVNYIDTWAEDFREIWNEGDGISWEQQYVMFAGSDAISRGTITQKIPLKAGEGVNFEYDEENNAIKVNATVDIPNSDYNENDPTKKSHIFNRPCYEDENLAETYNVSSYSYTLNINNILNGYNNFGLATNNVPSLEELCHCYTIDGNYTNGLTNTTSTFSSSLNTFLVISCSGGYVLRNSYESVVLVYDYSVFNTEYSASLPSNGIYLCSNYIDGQDSEGNMYTNYTKITTLHRLPIKKLDNEYLALPRAGYKTWGTVMSSASLSGSGWSTCPIVDGVVYYKDTTYTNWSLGQGYGTCSTAEATTAKTVSAYMYTLQTGGIVAVKFTNAVPANSTLNINSKGAKSIYYRGAKIVDGVIQAGDIATFIYNGSYYILLSVDRWGENMTELKAYVDETILGGAW